MLLLTFLIIFIIICALKCIKWFMNRHERAQMFWKIPGPPRSAFIGNLLDIAVPPVALFEKLQRWTQTYKDIFRLWLLLYGGVFINNPSDIEAILSNPTHNTKSRIYDCLKPWLHDGLLLSTGDKWQTRRKILTPAFHFNILQQFTTILEENSSRLVQKLERCEHEQTLDLIPLMSDVALNSVCETAMGTKISEDAFGAGNSYKNCIHEIGKLIIYRISNALLVLEPIFYFSMLRIRQNKILNIIHNFPKKIIAERRKYIEKSGFKVVSSNSNDDNTMLGPLKRRMVMLDLLLCAEKEGMIKEDGIQEEVDTFMFEGHDTSTLGLTYALLELANNRVVQDRAYKEVSGILGDSTQQATMQQLGQMKYLECCIKETLRLFPPVPIISREINQSVTLSGYTVPPGKTIVFIQIFELHRRADLYPDPLTFNPERFTPENNKNRHPYSYIPFSGGSRNCIGQKFAILQLKSVISSILRRFILEPVTKPEELEFSTDLLLRTTHPIYVKFVKRQ